jgi:prepilin-type N-terminal cleavage/methylation domain-containing protein
MNRKGFTLIELLVVIVIIGILVAIALPNFIKIKDKAKEAEVKQNLHAIQLGIERYAVDAEASNYPLVLMGGDWTDWYAVWQEWRDDQADLATMGGVNPQRESLWRAAPLHRGDTLIMEAYLPSYPQNPFNKQGGSSLLPRCVNFAGGIFGPPEDRVVGGRESNKMYEVFGPQWMFPSNNSIPNGDLFVHHIFNNPPYNASADVNKNPVGSTPWRSPSGNKVLIGNFSYYPRNAITTSFPWNAGAGGVQGYTLAGYGALRTGGQDVYNRNGNYKGRFRTSNCELACIGGVIPGEIPCICSGNNPPSITANNGGADTIIDGVVITLDSGVDKSSKKTDNTTTEGE